MFGLHTYSSAEYEHCWVYDAALPRRSSWSTDLEVTSFFFYWTCETEYNSSRSLVTVCSILSGKMGLYAVMMGLISTELEVFPPQNGFLWKAWHFLTRSRETILKQSNCCNMSPEINRTLWKNIIFHSNHLYCDKSVLMCIRNHAKISFFCHVFFFFFFGHLHFFAPRRVLRVQTNSRSLWLKLPEGIKALLLHSTSLPLLSVIFRPKKEKQGGSARADLMGCGIAICHSGHLDTYKWRREQKFQSLRVS